MPRIIMSKTEFRFVAPSYQDPRPGAKITRPTKPEIVENTRSNFEPSLRFAQRQVELCAEHGHEHDLAGCRTKVRVGSDDVWLCIASLNDVVEKGPSPERELLVQIVIPAPA